jgi:hypothetical protein
MEKNMEKNDATHEDAKKCCDDLALEELKSFW